MVERIINGKLTSTRGFDDLYPFESRFVRINGNTMHYIDEGRGNPVIMVHGNPTWSFYFRNVVKRLSPTCRAIVPDHIGCGFSDKPDARAYNYTLASRVRDLTAFIDNLNLDGKISLVVHDWGGMIGLAWAVDHLNRIDNIVITNTSGFFLPEDKAFPPALALIKYLTPFAVPAVLGGNVFSRGAAHLACTNRLDKKVRLGLTAPYNSWKNRIATLKFVQDIPISKKDQSYPIVAHVEKTLQQLDESRLMFLWGAKDFVFDLAFLNEFKRRFPRSPARVFHDAGHYLFEDRPDECCDLIEAFVNR